jgi:hypothetical protein
MVVFRQLKETMVVSPIPYRYNVPFPDVLRWSRKRVVSFLLSITAIISIFHLFLLNHDSTLYSTIQPFFTPQTDPKPTRASFKLPTNSTLDLSYLYKHNLSPKIYYSRRSIATQYFTGERPELTVTSDALFPPPQVVGGVSITEAEITSLPPINLQVPTSPDVDLSVMSFGISTPIDRLEVSIPHISHWLANTGSLLHVVSREDEKIAAVQDQMQWLGIKVNISTSDLDMPKAYFSIINHLYQNREPQTEWLAVFDDDTFVTSLPYLIQHLHKTYDSSIPTIVGAVTDENLALARFGLVPFGGGGIFISVSLAAQLCIPEVYEQCMLSGKGQGDGLVSECINTHTASKVIYDHGLNQMDIHSPAGYFESGRRMLTVHHWKSWFDVDVAASSLVSKACGDECIFQRWKFDSQRLVLNNGFSINVYDENVFPDINFADVEMTWPGQPQNYIHHISPLREAVTEGKKTFRMVESVVLEGLGVRQVYVWRDGDHKGELIDEVKELLWLFN